MGGENVSEPKKETICTHCQHKDVCMWVAQVMTTTSELEKMNSFLLELKTPLGVVISCGKRTGTRAKVAKSFYAE